MLFCYTVLYIINRVICLLSSLSWYYITGEI